LKAVLRNDIPKGSVGVICDESAQPTDEAKNEPSWKTKHISRCRFDQARCTTAPYKVKQNVI
jgi:hypothetical protein